MRKRDIIQGRIYVDNRGNAKAICNTGSEFALCGSKQRDQDCVQYTWVRVNGHDPKPGSVRAETKFKCTRKSFAKWAKNFF